MNGQSLSSTSGDPDSDYDYDEPMWEQATLEAINAIEAQHFDKLHPKQITKTIPTTKSIHLQIQLENQFNKRASDSEQKKSQLASPFSPHLSYKLLHQRFNSLIPNHRNKSSLYSRFRLNRHFLSVSDLVSCIWCQFQVEYGLLGKRYLRPSQRPKSFLSSSGIEIKVNSQLVVSRQNILDGGKRVHANLEKEVAPEQVRVEVVSQVDTWGLKVMNTIINLSLLRSTGMMREIHVWGFVGGFLVQGIIDQIDLITDSSTNDFLAESSPENKSVHNKFQQQLASPSHFNQSEKSSPRRDSIKRFSARISDSKTTQSITLPPPEYTESARYQLMLYKYLHDQNARGEFDLERFGLLLGINLDESFSSIFLRDIESLLKTTCKSLNDEDQGSQNPNTLRSMFKLYDRMIKMVGVSDETLEIVYRKRGGRQNGRTDGASPKKLKINHDKRSIQINLLDASPATPLPPNPLPYVNSFADQLEMSSNPNFINLRIQPHVLKEPSLNAKEHEKSICDSDKLMDKSDQLISFLNDNSIQNATQKEEEEEVTNAKDEEESRLSLSSPAPLMDTDGFSKIEKYFSKFSSVQNMRAKLDKHDNEKIIGSFEFDFHPIEFSKFIFDAIRFWNGDTDPVGVDIVEFNKCEKCEFKDGCEWRSKISTRILDSI